MPLIQFIANGWQKALPALAIVGAVAWLAAFGGDPTGERAIFAALLVIYMLHQIEEHLWPGGFRQFVEIGGPTYCAKYDGRSDLGNCEAGDGYRYRGRGPFMLTGRANYRKYGQILGLDLEANPDQAADPGVGLKIACLYWRDHHCNTYADADDLNAITRAINGGLTGLQDRADHLKEAKAVWP